MSSISKLRIDPLVAAQLGSEIRCRRLAMGLTQGELAAPFTRSYICAVELGRCMPSLPALMALAARLHTTPADLLAAVNPHTGPRYNPGRGHGDEKGNATQS